MKISNETKVGVLTTIAIIVFLLGYNFMMGSSVFKTSNNYYIVYDDLSGLSKSNPVFLSGLRVGQVESLRMITDRENDKYSVLVRISVQDDIEIPTNTIAKIQSTDFLGGRSIDLILGDAPTFAVHQDTLIGGLEISLTESMNHLIAPVKEKTENLITSVDSVITTLNNILTTVEIEKIFKSLQTSLESIKHASSALDEMVTEETSRMKGIFANVESISKNLDHGSEEFNYILKNFSEISDSIKAANIKNTLVQANEAITTLNEITDRINRGEGSAGLLINDPELYENLNSASKNVDALTRDLRENPFRYLNISLINLSRGQRSRGSDED